MRQNHEFEEQKAFVQYLIIRNIEHYHVPNGGSRNVREAKNLKASGVSPGVPDIHIPIQNLEYAGLFIEMKRAKPGKSTISVEQKKWIEKLNDNGYLAVVCYGADEAIKVTEKYLESRYLWTKKPKIIC